MSNAALSPSMQPGAPIAASVKQLVAAVLVVWFSTVLALGASGAFERPPGSPPLPIFIGFLLPLLVFLAAFRLSRVFRQLVLALDLRIVTAVQAWRFAGLGFIALYVYQVLPGMFAWPAGLGDIAIGLTAPWLVWVLIRRPEFASSRGFIVWNLLGILDLVVAVGSGTLSAMLASGVAGEVGTGPMAQLPLVLIPAYFVPLFVALHLAAILQARRRQPSV